MKRNKVKIYKLVVTSRGKIQETLGNAETEKEIYKMFNKLLKENKKTVFPKMYTNNIHVMNKANYELYIIKCKQHDDDSISRIRNEYGKYVEYESDDENWVIVDHAEWLMEETFFVYGYHPRFQRKDFNWVFENFIEGKNDGSYNMVTVQTLYNKVIFEDRNGINIVICKTKEDGTRMYNQLEAWCKKRKYKHAIFMGSLVNSVYKAEWVEKIRQRTNWPLMKIMRQSTRP
jgi:hypothetical protein